MAIKQPAVKKDLRMDNHDNRTEIELLRNDLRWIKRVIFVCIPSALVFITLVIGLFFGLDVKSFKDFVRAKVEQSAITYAIEQSTNAANIAVDAKDKAERALKDTYKELSDARRKASEIYLLEDSLGYSVTTIPIQIQCGDSGKDRANPYDFDFNGRTFGSEVIGVWLVPYKNIDVFTEYVDVCDVYRKTFKDKN